MSVKLFVGITNGLELRADEQVLEHLKREQVSKLERQRINGGTKKPRPIDVAIQHMLDQLMIVGQCWIWPHAKIKGYGMFRINARHWRLPRLVYWLTRGTLEIEDFVCHECDNPSCCNPDHLFLGDAKKNYDDAKLKDRHTRGERSAHAKLKDEDVMEIRKLHIPHSREHSNKALAKMFGMSEHAIFNITSRKTWTHLP